ncbi:MAG: hypothetical protein V2I33_11565 [Kangiellaceae bacterium]|jgi:hypothetical protein|nr:hypothetical protein [Kangiellaceae bacterium]
MRKTVGLLSKFFLLYLVFQTNLVIAEPEKVIIYGDNHIFTVDRAENWILDRELAASQGIGSFFYPADNGSKTETYFYATGWEKPRKDSTLSEFIESNISQIKQRFPDVTYKKVKQGTSGAIRQAWMYTYENMGNRFKEEVIYLESDTTVINLVFSTKSEASYKKYVKDFDKMSSSFEYLSSDPEIIKKSLKDITTRSK